MNYWFTNDKEEVSTNLVCLSNWIFCGKAAIDIRLDSS